MSINGTTQVYCINASSHNGTPAENLFGDIQIIFLDRNEADAVALDLLTNPCWADSQTAEDIGIGYSVTECLVSELGDNCDMLSYAVANGNGPAAVLRWWAAQNECGRDDVADWFAASAGPMEWVSDAPREFTLALFRGIHLNLVEGCEEHDDAAAEALEKIAERAGLPYVALG